MDHGLEEKLQAAQKALRKFFMQPEEVRTREVGFKSGDVFLCFFLIF